MGRPARELAPHLGVPGLATRRVGRVERASAGDRLIPLDGLTELGRDTPAEVLAVATELSDEAVAVADVYLCPVVPHPDKIICVGLNYRAHIEETGRDLPDLSGHVHQVRVQPHRSPRRHPAAPGVRTGRLRGRARRRDRPRRPSHPARPGAEHILGYTVANDVTMRDFQYKTHQWLQGKAWDNSTPLGPYLVPPGEADVVAAGVRTIMGGEKLQDSDTSRLIFDIPTLVATVSEFTTVLPGDVILTGTPGGVGFRREPPLFLRDGDEITVEVDGIWSLTNRVRREG